MFKRIFQVRYVPEWMPGAGFKRLARDLKKQLSDIDRAPFDWAKSQIVNHSQHIYVTDLSSDSPSRIMKESGSFKESFVSGHILDETFASSKEEREDILQWCAISMYAGGGDSVNLFIDSTHCSICNN
jgi:hypothetical protein